MLRRILLLGLLVLAPTVGPAGAASGAPFDAAAFARAQGKPTVVRYFHITSSRANGRTSLMLPGELRTFLAAARAQTTLGAAAVTCLPATVVRSARAQLPAGLTVDSSVGCARALDRTLASITRDDYASRLLDASGAVQRFTYQVEITLRSVGIDSTAKQSTWLGLARGADLYAVPNVQNAVFFQHGQLLPGASAASCSDLREIASVIPTCTFDLSRFSGPVVVVAFEAGCPTCEASKGEYLYQRWADQHPSVQVVAVTCDDPTTAWMWANARGWKFPMLAEGSFELGKKDDYEACWNTLYKPLGLTWWGDIAYVHGAQPDSSLTSLSWST